MKKQLVAIFYADVAGYSRLTGQNVERTHRQLDEGLTLLSNTISAYEGHKDHEAGDAILAEFPSVTAAVEAAVELQKSMAGLNTNLPENDRVRFRIGINVGEVIHDRGDIYGDGVNIAARIQDIAPPGGLCVSSAVFEQLVTETSYTFDDLGYRDFKNIARPIHVYQVRIPDLLDVHPMQDIEARVEHQPLFGDVVDSAPVTSGRCICGSVRFDITHESLGSGLCHCRICQRSTGAPAFAWTAFPTEAVKFTGDQPKYYRLSLIAERGYCEKCASPVTWRSLKPKVADYLVVTTMSLDNPEDYAPSWHGCVESQMPWLQIHDDLPRKRGEEAPLLVKAWSSVEVVDPEDWKELEYEQVVSLDDDRELP